MEGRGQTDMAEGNRQVDRLIWLRVTDKWRTVVNTVMNLLVS
jgi:hypothetical protein